MNSASSQPKTVYVIASEQWRGQWVPDGFTYVHADDPATARYQFIAGLTTRERLTCRVVAIAPAIGYIQDNSLIVPERRR